MKSLILLTVVCALAHPMFVSANEPVSKSLALVKASESLHQSTAMVKADERLLCETMLMAGNWIQRFFAQRRLERMNDEYFHDFDAQFSRYRSSHDDYRYFSKVENRLYVLNYLREDFRNIGDKDVEMFAHISQHDPVESVRKLAFELLTDPPTPEKVERKAYEKLKNSAPQRALMLDRIGFFGGDTVDQRIASLRNVERRALTLSKEQLGDLRLVAERDEHVTIRSIAGRIVSDPLAVWMNGWTNFYRIESRLAFLEHFERNFDSLNALQKQAILEIAKTNVPVVSKIAKELAARLTFRDGPYR